MDTDSYHSRMLTISIWIAGLATAGFMVADIITKPPVTWLTLMPVYCLAVFALLHSMSFLGPRRALWFLTVGLLVSFAAEYLGTNFGAIFGSHWFARARDLRLEMGVMLPGRVPLGIVLTWYGMLYIAFLVSTYLVRSRPSNTSAFTAVPLATGLLMAFWQLTAGPMAVVRGTMGFARSGFYHGIPLSSFIGWFATAMFVILFFQTIEPAAADTDRFLKNPRTGSLAFIMFGLTLVYPIVMCFRMKLFGAAWLGVVVLLLVMLTFAIRGRSLVPVARMNKAMNPTS